MSNNGLVRSASQTPFFSRTHRSQGCISAQFNAPAFLRVPLIRDFLREVSR